MMKLERQYGYAIDSYLTNVNGSNCPPYITFKEETVKLMEKYFGNSNNSKSVETLKQALPYEEGKVSRYHEFMKGLQLLDALHSAWLMLIDIIGVTIVRFCVRHVAPDLCCYFRMKIFVIIT